MFLAKFITFLNKIYLTDSLFCTTKNTARLEKIYVYIIYVHIFNIFILACVKKETIIF